MPCGSGPGAPGGEALGDPDEVTAAALEDLEDHWAETMPEVYDTAFEPLRGGYVPYGPDTPLPSCGHRAPRPTS